jgi:hypothetical protein
MRFPWTFVLVSCLPWACALGQSQPKPVLTQYEKQQPLASREDKSCKGGYRRSFTTSKLTVFDNLEVLYEPTEHTFCEVDPVRFPVTPMDWNFPPGEN